MSPLLMLLSSHCSFSAVMRLPMLLGSHSSFCAVTQLSWRIGYTAEILSGLSIVCVSRFPRAVLQSQLLCKNLIFPPKYLCATNACERKCACAVRISMASSQRAVKPVACTLFCPSPIENGALRVGGVG